MDLLRHPVERHPPIQRLAVVDQQPACHRIAHNVKFPIIVIFVARRAAQRSGFRFVVTSKRAHEIRRALDNLVGIDIQLKRIFLVLGNLIQHVLIMARRIRNSALRIPFPGTENRLLIRRANGQPPDTNDQADDQRTEHMNDGIISEAPTQDHESTPGSAKSSFGIPVWPNEWR